MFVRNTIKGTLLMATLIAIPTIPTSEIKAGKEPINETVDYIEPVEAHKIILAGKLDSLAPILQKTDGDMLDTNQFISIERALSDNSYHSYRYTENQTAQYKEFIHKVKSQEYTNISYINDLMGQISWKMFY